MANLAGNRARIPAIGSRVFATVLNIVLPPQCLACGTIVAEQGSICTDCWQGIDFLARPFCHRCGYPFEIDQGPEALCGACLRTPPVYHRARSVMRYDGVARNLVLGFKHGDRTHGAPAFGRWLARAGVDLLGETDLIVPVPLHPWRLARRRFNQAALLAQALGAATGEPVRVNLLRRVRRTPTQGGLNRRQRARNVRRAFLVAPGQIPVIAGRRLLLIDDVLTTGATANECAATLLKNGAAQVDILTLTRVIRPES